MSTSAYLHHIFVFLFVLQTKITLVLFENFEAKSLRNG
jgi:hypothetical protein